MNAGPRVMVSPDTTILDVIARIDTARGQTALVVDDRRRLLGTVTDGDVRRAILRGTAMTEPVERIMNREPKTASPGDSRDAAIARMRAQVIRDLPVVDADRRVVDLYSLAELFEASRLDNWVILMAGGEGSRLRPLTEDCPKPLMSIAGKPILEITLENLAAQGFNRFFLSVNYMAERFEAHFGDGARWNVSIEYLRETEKLGTAGCLALLPERPRHPFIVANGDLLTKVSFRRPLEFHVSSGAAATMCSSEYRVQVPFGVVRLEGDRIVEVAEKPVYSYPINAGIYILDPDVLDGVPEGRPLDMPALFHDLARAGRKVCSFPIHEYWLDVGRMSDLERARAEFDDHFS